MERGGALNLLRLSIQQTYAQIGMNTQQASLSLSHRSSELTIDQEPAQMEIEQPNGQLAVDSSAAWAALAKGGNLEWKQSIYSQAKEVVLQAIAKKVEDGNRMAAIHTKSDAIAELAMDAIGYRLPVQYAGAPSYTNVKVNYTAEAAKVTIIPQKADIQYQPAKLEGQYERGDVNIYVKQRQSIAIEVSPYNWYA